MPPAVAVVASAAFSAGLSFATGATIFGLTALESAAVIFSANVVLGVASMALAPKPKASAFDLSSFAQDRTITVRQAAAPWRVVVGETRVGGIYAFLHTTDNNRKLHMVVVWACHPCKAIKKLYFADEEVPLDADGNATGRYAGVVKCKHHLGDPDQPADADLMAAVPTLWTADHRLRGRTYSYIQLTFDADKFPNGVPNPTVLLQGAMFYDPRTGDTDWTDNPDIIKAGYLENASYGLAVDRAQYIDEVSLIAAANANDELVPLADGGTEKRYTCNGTFTLDMPPRDVIQELNTSNVGKVIWSGGKWRFYSGVYIAPTATIGLEDLRAGYEIRTRETQRNNFNAVKGTYVSPADFYNVVSFPAVKSAAYIAEDNGETRYKDIRLPYTDSPSMAQRIAKIILLRARQQITAAWPCKFSAYATGAPHTVAINNDDLGWDEKPFEIEASTLAIEEDDSGFPVFAVDLLMHETSPAVYDWQTSEEQTVDPAPNTNLPDMFDPAGVSNVALESGTTALQVLGDGTIISRIRVTWTASPEGFLDHYEVQFKKSADSEWQDIPPVARNSTVAFIGPVEDGVAYDVRVRAVNVRGVGSAWETVTGHMVIGKTQPPTTPTGMSAVPIVKGVKVTWNAVTDADLAHYEIWRNTVNDSSTATKIAVAHTTNFSDTALVAGTTYYYWVKSVDTSGNVSEFSAAASAEADAAVSPGDISSISAQTNDVTISSNFTWTTLASVTIQTSGQSVLLLATYAQLDEEGITFPQPGFGLRLTRNGTSIYSIEQDTGGDTNFGHTLQYLDTPTAGTHTYAFQLYHNVYRESTHVTPAWRIYRGSIYAQELKA